MDKWAASRGLRFLFGMTSVPSLWNYTFCVNQTWEMIFVLTVKHSFNSPVFLFPTIILFVNKNLSYLVIYVLFCLFFFFNIFDTIVLQSWAPKWQVNVTPSKIQTWCLDGSHGCYLVCHSECSSSVLPVLCCRCCSAAVVKSRIWIWSWFFFFFFFGLLSEHDFYCKIIFPDFLT